MPSRPITIVVSLWFAVVCSVTFLAIVALLGSAALNRHREPTEKYTFTRLNAWSDGKRYGEAWVRMDKVTGKTEFLSLASDGWREFGRSATAKAPAGPEKN